MARKRTVKVTGADLRADDFDFIFHELDIHGGVQVAEARTGKLILATRYIPLGDSVQILDIRDPRNPVTMNSFSLSSWVDHVQTRPDVARILLDYVALLVCPYCGLRWGPVCAECVEDAADDVIRTMVELRDMDLDGTQ